jgi:hypothetical protein
MPAGFAGHAAPGPGRLMVSSMAAAPIRVTLSEGFEKPVQ